MRSSQPSSSTCTRDDSAEESLGVLRRRLRVGPERPARAVAREPVERQVAGVDRPDERLALRRGGADVRLEAGDRGVLADVPERVRALVRVRRSRRHAPAEDSPRPSLDSTVAGTDLRDREPEGRRRQDDDRRQPRRLPRRGGRAGAARRSRPAGERDLRARRAGERRRRATTCSTARRSPSSPGRPASGTSISCPRSPTSPAPRSSSRDHADGERYLAELARRAPATATPSSSSTARRRSGR